MSLLMYNYARKQTTNSTVRIEILAHDHEVLRHLDEEASTNSTIGVFVKSAQIGLARLREQLGQFIFGKRRISIYSAIFIS